MKVTLNGDVVPNDSTWFYDWFGVDYIAPSKLTDAINSEDDEVEIVINSGGGDVFAASEIYTMLKDSGKNIVATISGLAASAASVIAMAGNKVQMSPTAQLMIHNVSSYGEGDYRDMDKMSDILQNANDSIANAYMVKTGKQRDEVLALMNDETWMSADKAKSLGFIDEIMFAKEDTPALVNSISSIDPNKIKELRNMIMKNASEDEEKKEDESQDTGTDGTEDTGSDDTGNDKGSESTGDSSGDNPDKDTDSGDSGSDDDSGANDEDKKTDEDEKKKDDTEEGNQANSRAVLFNRFKTLEQKGY